MIPSACSRALVEADRSKSSSGAFWVSSDSAMFSSSPRLRFLSTLSPHLGAAAGALMGLSRGDERGFSAAGLAAASSSDDSLDDEVGDGALRFGFFCRLLLSAGMPPAWPWCAVCARAAPAAVFAFLMTMLTSSSSDFPRSDAAVAALAALAFFFPSFFIAVWTRSSGCCEQPTTSRAAPR